MKNIFICLILFASFLYGEKTIIGKNEYITFNEFNLNNLRAKIDTGAKTSSIHCSVIHQIDKNKVAFTLLDSDHKKFKAKLHTAQISRIGKVKSSNGKIQKRIFIKTTITFLGKTYLTEFSLTNRGSMKFPILIGRSLLQNDFLVDVTKEYTQ